MEGIVAQRIKSVLEDKQMSIAAFAKKIGMQQVTCNRQIRGDQAVSLTLIEGFLREFDNISAEWLLRGKGNKYGSYELDMPDSLMAAEPSPTYHRYKNDSEPESIWKAKYEAIKDCYDMLVSSLGGNMGKRNVG